MSTPELAAAALVADTTAGTDTTRPRRRLTLRAAIGWIPVLALLVLVLVFRPTSLGGFTSYIFVSGVSMEPTMHTGDLAILVPADTYRVGDIVAYHPAQAPTGTIIHRITGGDAASGFVIRGDNRTTDDFDRPMPSELLGRSVVCIPSAGWLLETIRNPIVLGAIAALLAVFLAWEYVPGLKKSRTPKAG